MRGSFRRKCRPTKTVLCRRNIRAIASMSAMRRIFVRVAAVLHLSTSVAAGRVELGGLAENPAWLDWAISA
jgi:hypothetical protein